jgi:putative restriction endonuclease
MQVYGHRCAVTGCTAEDALEAAHLRSYASSGNNSVRNGMLVRADLHRLIDAGKLGFEWRGDELLGPVRT